MVTTKGLTQQFCAGGVKGSQQNKTGELKMDKETFDRMKPIHGTNIARHMANNVNLHWWLDQAETVEDLKQVISDLIDMALPRPIE